MYDKHSNAGKKNYKKYYLLFPILAIAAVLLFGAVVQWLWNAILPPLTSAGIITYWQSVGLLVLCRILFGGFRGGSNGGNRWNSRRKWDAPPPQSRDRWMQMSEEERMQFKEAWRDRCRKKED